MDRSKKPIPNLSSQRRFELLDLNKSSSSLNMSTSSLRSVGEETRKGGAAVQASRRATAVRFAPPPPSSAAMSAKANSGSVSHSQQAMARPATASGARPGSAAGPRCRTSAGRLREPGPKAMRRNWGWTGGVDAKEKGSSNPVAAKTHSRSSSAPRRLPPSEEKEKPQPKRGSKIMTTSRKETNPATPPKTEMEGSRSPPDIARRNTKAPNCVSLKNMDMVSPPPRTSVTTIGASWDSLPSDVQSLGQEVMEYRGDAEVAAVEALKEASAAEILLRCLSAFAELASAAAKHSPQETVDEFLALHTALTGSNAAVPGDDKQSLHAGDWLRAAVSTDLAAFSLYSPMRNSSQAVGSPPAASRSPPSTRRPNAAGEASAEEEITWLEAARRRLGEEMRAWFLGHVERLLDGDVAGTLGQLKRVNDWLDAVGPGPESEAVERVRKKIYGYLLDHVESAVVALNGGVAPGGRRK
ncbi:hypothetical protein SEVIR_8G105800v4 [Setaria viridis]|uniref:DUF6857 domain-containing protein n=1 Tax=Setaria viridis TaxID=4556 RepID=A0A4U6TE15_SETVI|nr:Holliday junction resolvase MOC1, chloroplastic-like [Setaria viridis]TKW00391.1 hypothetical protein SEVIR_8G105800v2 [Setaria viridis]